MWLWNDVWSVPAIGFSQNNITSEWEVLLWRNQYWSVWDTVKWTWFNVQSTLDFSNLWSITSEWEIL